MGALNGEEKPTLREKPAPAPRSRGRTQSDREADDYLVPIRSEEAWSTFSSGTPGTGLIA